MYYSTAYRVKASIQETSLFWAKLKKFVWNFYFC